MPPDLPDLLRPGGHRPLWIRALCLLGSLVFFALGVVGWLIPILTGLPFGHVPTKVSLPVGARVQLLVQGRDVLVGW